MNVASRSSLVMSAMFWTKSFASTTTPETQLCHACDYRTLHQAARIEVTPRILVNILPLQAASTDDSER